LLTLFSFKAHSQFLIKGKVVSFDKRQPIQGVTISLGNKVLATTDVNGSFELKSTVEKTKLLFSHVGYESLLVDFINGQNKSVELHATDDNLLSVTVKAFEKNTSLKKNTNNIDYCLICNNNIKFGEFKRTINKCKHFFHKKCFDKIINISDNVNCIVCNDKFF
jgi:hypothetical protein